MTRFRNGIQHEVDALQESHAGNSTLGETDCAEYPVIAPFSKLVCKRLVQLNSMRPHYVRVFWTFFPQLTRSRDDVSREFCHYRCSRARFWFAAQLTLFEIIFRSVRAINDWNREEYFAFMATGMLINAIVETFFMPNCANFSELIRKGDLDFVLLKPIDTQFLISFEKVNLPMLNQVLFAGALLGYAFVLTARPGET